MLSTAPVSSRRVRGLAAAACAAVLLPVAAASPALAQTTTSERAAATSASALRLTINLPQANQILLDIDPVTGTVRAVTGSGPEAEALATLIRGSIAGNAQSFPGAEARLPEPTEGSGPTNAVGDGINDSPLGAFLNVGLLTADAAVTEAPSSTSTAQIASLDLGLPAEIGDALAQVLDPLLAGLDEIITQLGPLDEATQALCDGIEPVTTPVGDGVEAVPVLGPVLDDVVDGVTNQEAGLLCNLRAFLGEVRDELALSLEDLVGPGGLVGTGLIAASQTITTEGARTTATATAQIADLQILGQDPFATAEALETTSTASIDGATPTATVETTAVEAFAAPLLTLETDLDAVTGDLAGIEIDGLTEVLAQIETLLEALAGIGVEAGPLDEAGTALTACPEDLGGQLSGTFESPTCAAAAARGFGLAVTLPEPLATPLGITGPLVALQLVPSAAVVRATTTTTAAAGPPPPTEPFEQLPRTGAEAPVAAAGLLLLLGAALVRRRRAVEA